MRQADAKFSNPVTSAVTYTAKAEDDYIGITNTDQARTVNLPTAASVGQGKIVVVKDQSGAAGTNNITIDASGNELIDGAATKVISANYGSAMLYCSGSAWFSI